MLLIKSFFRKRSNRISIIIFMFLFLSMIVMQNYIKKYDEVADNFYHDYTYITFVSSEDYSNYFEENELIKRVERGLMLRPNFELGTIKPITLETKPYEHIWDYFLVNDEYIILYFDDSYNLKKGDVVIGTHLKTLTEEEKEYIDTLIGKPIGGKPIYNEKQEYEYTIVKFVDTVRDTIFISKEDYEEIRKNSNTKTFYRIIPNKYDKAEKLREELFNLKHDEEFNVCLFAHGDWSANQKVISLINFLKLSDTFLLILIFAIVLISHKNLLKEEEKNIYIKRIVGFNKKHIMINILVNSFIMLIIAYMLSIFLSIIFLLFLNLFLNSDVNIVNLEILFKTFISIVCIFIIEILFFIAKIRKYLKKI